MPWSATVAGGVVYATGHISIGGWLLGITALTDVLDGMVARRSNTSSQFGAFLDSTLDRVADGFTMGGLAVFFAFSPVHRSPTMVAVCITGLIGAFLTSVYVLRVAKQIFWGPPSSDPHFENLPDARGTEWAALGILVFVLVLFGAGSLVGVTVAGRLSDRRPGAVVAVGGPLLLIGWPLLAVSAHMPLALCLLVFALGALSFALGGTLITRVLHEAVEAPTMAGSYATAALNIGAAVGPLIAATTLGTAAGNRGPLWASGLLVALTLLIALPFRRSLAPTGRPAEARA